MPSPLEQVLRSVERFVPAAFLKAIGKSDITEARLGDHTNREVTILFTDIRDYTTLAESMTPEDNYLLMNAYHRRMGPLIARHHGFVHQFLGDGLMCVFPGRPDDALEATIAMQQYLGKYNEERASKGREELRVGMGMHTGMLIMGITGDGQRLDAAAISDSVNIAARMEGLTKLFGTPVLLSDDSYIKLICAEDYLVRFLGKVQVKGKTKPVGVNECLETLPEDQYAKKVETLALFDEAQDHYYDMNFTKAADLFRSILDQQPEDLPVRWLLSNAEQYASHGVPDDWNGVESLEVK